MNEIQTNSVKLGYLHTMATCLLASLLSMAVGAYLAHRSPSDCQAQAKTFSRSSIVKEEPSVSEGVSP